MPEETGAAGSGEGSQESSLSSADSANTQSGASAQESQQPTGIFSEGLNFREGWFNDIDDPAFDEVRATAQNYKDLPTVFKSLVENKRAATQRLDGMVKIPGENATDEERAAFNSAMGIPETPDAYEFQIPDALPEGIEIDSSLLKGFAEFAHKQGITPAQANAIVQYQIQAESNALTNLSGEQQQSQQAAQEQLSREWGPKYDGKMISAQRAAATFGLAPEMVQNPDIARAMARVAEQLSEDKLVAADKITGNLSPGSEAKDILSNPDNPLYNAFHDSTHPQHRFAVETRLKKLEEEVRRSG